MSTARLIAITGIIAIITDVPGSVLRAISPVTKPAVMITDTALHRYRHYHAPSDTPDKLAYPELARVTYGLFAAFSELARGVHNWVRALFKFSGFFLRPTRGTRVASGTLQAGTSFSQFACSPPASDR
jgi:hypothetical protein